MQCRSRRTFFRHTMLDTLYKTDNAKCSQLLLKYRNGSQLFVAYTVLAYAMTMYAVTAYAVTSLIQIQPLWRQHSESEDPEALSLLHCVLLLWIFLIPLTCRSSMVWYCDKSGLQLIFLFSLFICRAVSIHRHV